MSVPPWGNTPWQATQQAPLNSPMMTRCSQRKCKHPHYRPRQHRVPARFHHTSAIVTCQSLATLDYVQPHSVRSTPSYSQLGTACDAAESRDPCCWARWHRERHATQFTAIHACVQDSPLSLSSPFSPSSSSNPLSPQHRRCRPPTESLQQRRSEGAVHAAKAPVALPVPLPPSPAARPHHTPAPLPAHTPPP